MGCSASARRSSLVIANIENKLIAMIDFADVNQTKYHAFYDFVAINTSYTGQWWHHN